MTKPTRLSAAQARRVAVAAHGLGGPRPDGRVGLRRLSGVIRRLGAIQIDSVNVLARAHLVPFFSRLGPYAAETLHRAAYEDHVAFEYWGHAASLVDVELEPYLRWRMADTHHWRRPTSVANRRRDLVEALERAVVEDGPVSAAALEERLAVPSARKGPWWDWSDTKAALEYLFWAGRVGALRTPGFERVYCSPDIAVPPQIRARPTPDPDAAKRALLKVAVAAHGVGTAGDLADYWRFKTTETRGLLRAMAADGEVLEVDVEGWEQPGYAAVGLRVPRAVRARALVSPFDVAMWARDRVSRLHRFDYTIEIYVPEHLRRYGYYTLPFLLGDTFVARVDLKADRRNRVLLVRSAHAEPDLDVRRTGSDEVATELAAELRLMAGWLGLEDIAVDGRGDLVTHVRAAMT